MSATAPFLLFRDAADREQQFVLEPGRESVSVGRQASSDLVLDWDQQVSRLHALLERSDGDWEVVDDGLSSNGTFVNGRRLSGRCRLNDGDAVRFGDTTVTFRQPVAIPSAAPQRPTPAAPAAPTPIGLSSTQRRVLVALCRPYKQHQAAHPASDERIAEDLIMSVGEVRTHLSVLCAKLGVAQSPPSEARVRLADAAFAAELVAEKDL